MERQAKEKIKEEVRKFIVNNFMLGKGNLQDGDSLFVENIIDSSGMLELIGFIEKKFRLPISPSWGEPLCL